MHPPWARLLHIICLKNLFCQTYTWDGDNPSLSTLIKDLEFIGGDLGERKDIIPQEIERVVSTLRDIDQFCPVAMKPDRLQFPREFDARKEWRPCAKLIETIWNQGDCRSSSVIAAASMAADRLCIATNGTFQSTLSAQYLMACSSSCDRNEPLSTPMDFLRDNGIPTGSATASDKTSRSGCVPYQVPPCCHVSRSAQNQVEGLKPCNFTDEAYNDYECPEECTNDAYHMKLDPDLHKMKCTYEIEECEENKMRKDIYNNGPIVAGFVLFDDFLDYKKGVYRHYGYGPYIRIHFVKLIGWGVEKKVPYWLGVNSFGNKWGMHGLFKFFRGRNHLFIETMVAAGHF